MNYMKNYGEREYPEKKDKVVGEILETWDYDKFTFWEWNRDIKPHHKNNLAESFTIKQLSIPIIVNQFFKVAEGQHRLEVSKDLGKPVYYTIIRNITKEDVQRLNETMLKWGAVDYLKLHMEQGKEAYFRYNDFKNKYKFGHNETLHLLYCVKPEHIKNKGNPGIVLGSRIYHVYKNGNLEIFDYDASCFLAEEILKTKPYYKGYKYRKFIFAMLQCFSNEKYNHEQFIYKLSIQPDKLTTHASVDDYLQKIQSIYNFKTYSRNKVRLYSGPKL